MGDRFNERHEGARHGEERITETKEEARQGETTAPMGKVMLISTVAAFVILMIILFAFVF